jgi:hypothetical protein
MIDHIVDMTHKNPRAKTHTHTWKPNNNIKNEA